MLSPCRFWFDSELLWENPRDVRPYHVQTAWYWSPDDTRVVDAMIQVKSVSVQPSWGLPLCSMQTFCVEPDHWP